MEGSGAPHHRAPHHRAHHKPMKATMEEANRETLQPLKKVMVFCDGTWCGQLTGTDTNVKILADAVAGRHVGTREPFETKDGRIVGCYFDGEGVQGGFADYILDGSLGGKIKDDCLEVYRFIMNEFEESDGKCEAWMVGLSRGSYTVRCVGGMINNCGLISKKVIKERLGDGHPTEDETKDIINRAYDYYRDRTDRYKPDSPVMVQWKKEHSRVTKRPPTKFMGLFETVGALGIPTLDPGTGVDYYGDLNFYGKPEEGASAVSGEVECVYQALALHDRLSVFRPCHAKRDKFNKDFSYNKEPFNLDIEYKTEELWFPGAHYDLGRQKFMFYKSPSLLPPDSPGMICRFQIKNLITEVSSRLIQRSVSFGATRLLRIPDIHPNYKFSNSVLEWMIKKMAKTDPAAFGTLCMKVDTKVQHDSLPQKLFNLLTLKPAPLHNDAYDHLVDNAYLNFDLLPFAHRFLVGLFSRYLLIDRTIVDPLPATPATSTEPALPPGPDVNFHIPEILLIASKSYRSRSFDSYKLALEMQNKEVRLVEQ